MAQPLQSKIGFGAKKDFPAAITSGALDAYDIVCLDTEEVGWVSPSGEPVISKAKTQDTIQVKGVTGLGIADGQEIPAGQTLDEIVRMLVQKVVPATYVKPQLSLSGTKVGDYEVGETVTDTLTANFVPNDSAGLSSLVIKNSKGESFSENPLVQNIQITEGTVTYTATANYMAATIKTDNFGNPSSDNAFADGSLSNSVQYHGYWNTFYGTAEQAPAQISSTEIRALSDKELNLKSGDSFSISLGVGEKWICFAYPSSLADVKEVKYVELNDGSMAENFNKILVSVNGANGAVGREYKVYTYELATPAQAPMTFQVTL